MATQAQREKRRRQRQRRAARKTGTAMTRGTPKVNKPNSAASVQRMITRLGSCSSEYALSLENPFATGPVGCIPSYPTIKSQRTKLWNRGSFDTGSDGYGFIVMNPWAVSSDANTTSAGIADGFVQYSTPTYTGAGVITLNVVGTPVAPSGSVVSAQPNSPFTRTQFGTTSALVQYRIVSAGLRIKFSGTALNQGGIVYGLHQPNHETLLNYTRDTMMSFDEGGKFVITGQNSENPDKWFTVLYKPVDPFDCEFAFNPTNPGTVTAATSFPMGFIVKTAATGSQPFEYEAFANVEFTGAPARAKSLSYADPVGFAAVQTALNASGNPPTYSDANTRTASLLSLAGQYLEGVMTHPETQRRAVNMGVAGLGMVFDRMRLGGAVNNERRMIPY